MALNDWLVIQLCWVQSLYACDRAASYSLHLYVLAHGNINEDSR